jgi:twitching motility protein PilT
MVLHTVVSQHLLPDKKGGLVPAYEIMHMTPAIRSMIRDNKTHQIPGALAAGAAEGMCSMDQAILALFQKGEITKETALDYAENPEQLKRRLG